MTQESKNGLLVGGAGVAAALILGVLLAMVLSAKSTQPTQINVSLPPELKLSLSSDNPLVSNQITQPEAINRGLGGILEPVQTHFAEGLVSEKAILPFKNYSSGMDLGSFEKSWRDIFASGTNYSAKIVATSSDSTIAGSKICTANGTNCPGHGSDAFWTYDNALPGYYRASSTAELVGFGTATPTGFITIDGDQNVVQLIAKGHSTQTADVFQTKNNANAVLFSITNVGNVSASGTLNIIGASTLTGAVAASSTLQVTGATSLYATSTFYSDMVASSTLTVWSGSNRNRIGVGTSSPSHLLTVDGGGATTSVRLGAGSTSGAGTCIDLVATNGTRLYLYASSTFSSVAPWTSLNVSTVSCH